MNKALLWGGAYAVFSVASFGISFFVSAAKSYDFLTFVQELTHDYRLTVLLNFIVFCFLAFGYVSIRVGFGQIRIIEIEHIADSLPFYGINLLFILFNDSNLLLNMTWTGLTVLMKVYHIITYDRVDLLQVQIVNRMSQHPHTKARVLAAFLSSGYVFSLLLFLALDLVMARFLAYDVFQGVGSIGSLLFGIQFGVMGIDCFAYMGKLVLNVYELMFYRCASTNEDDLDDEDDLDEQIWEHRAFYMQGFDIVISALKVVFYAVFLYTLYFHSRLALPIPLIQGCIVSMHSVVKQTVQFLTFLTQAQHLEKQLSTPSEDELSVADHMCIICREDMHNPAVFLGPRGRPLNPRKHPKMLRCGHILHLCCLKDWLERSDSCPLCRKVVFSKSPAPPAQNSPENSPENVPDASVPAAPAPVDRPTAPAATATATTTEMHEAAHLGLFPTPTSTASGVGPQSAGSGTSGALPDTETVASSTAYRSYLPSASSGNSVNFRTNSANSAVSGAPSFVPRDWASFSVVATSDPRTYRVNISATQSVQLTVRRSALD